MSQLVKLAMEVSLILQDHFSNWGSDIVSEWQTHEQTISRSTTQKFQKPHLKGHLGSVEMGAKFRLDEDHFYMYSLKLDVENYLIDL